MKFCSSCGSMVVLSIPEGDDRERFVCSSCEIIHYVNPRVIVGCLPVYQDRVLLCKRAIEPRRNYWTLPAGFMENGETTLEGAARETWEEARAEVGDMQLYRVFDVPYINQVYMFYRCDLQRGEYGAGPESLGVLQLASRCSKEIRARDVALAEAIGRQIGVAIQKARLTDDLQISLRRMNALYESNVAITSTLDLRATLQIILDKIATVTLDDFCGFETGLRRHRIHIQKKCTW